MDKQVNPSALNDELAQVRTKKKEFLEQIERIVPWGERNTWHFGYKTHVGIDKDSELVHTVEVTPANTHDITMTPKLLTGEEKEIYEDTGRKTEYNVCTGKSHFG